MVGAVLFDEIFQLVVGEDDRVEVEPLQIFGRHPVDFFAAIGPRRGGMIDAPGVGRQIAAAMGDDELEVGMVVEHPTKDQMMDGDGRIERVADYIDQVMVGKPSRLGKTGRVHEDQHSELFDPREDLAEALGREILAGNVGRDLDAAKAQ